MTHLPVLSFSNRIKFASHYLDFTKLAFGVAALLITNSPLTAAQFGNFTYQEVGTTIEIIDYPETAVGNVTIPDTIDGKPVTSIGESAFQGCYEVLGISIPDTVENIGNYAFQDCRMVSTFDLPSGLKTLGISVFKQCYRLTTIEIPQGITNLPLATFETCSSLRFVTLPHTLTKISDVAFINCSSLREIIFPKSLGDIGYSAFENCGRLAKITFPTSVFVIRQNAFKNCSSLVTATFLGDAPASEFASNVFSNAAPTFKVNYLSNRSGFTSPTWFGFPTEAIDVALYPNADWLLSNGFAFDTDLQADPNDDGVDLRVAFALNLDPRKNLADSLPDTVFDNGLVSLRFYAGRPGITYSVQASSDLLVWSSEGIILSELDADGYRTASVPGNSQARFLRIGFE